MYLYSPSNRAFYLPGVHTDIPSDAVACPKEHHAALMAGVPQGKEIVPGPGGVPMLADPVRTLEQRIAALEAGVQAHLDAQAQARGYDDIRSAVTYADEPAVPQFQLEGLAFRAWRSMVWEACYQLLGEFQAGQIAEPTLAEVIAALPPAPTFA